MNSTPTNTDTATPDEAALVLAARIKTNRDAVHLALVSALDNFAAAINSPTSKLYNDPATRSRASYTWAAVSGLVHALCIDA